jgi:hypothetical protein
MGFLELDPNRKLALTSPETTAKIRAALTQFRQGNAPSAAQLERAQEEYLAYKSELNAPRPAWWPWAHGLAVWSDEEKRQYAWINSPDWPANPPRRRPGHIGSFVTYNAMGEAEEPSKAPAIALGVVGLAALGVAGYFAFRPSPAAAAPQPAPTPKPAPMPTPPKPVVTAPPAPTHRAAPPPPPAPAGSAFSGGGQPSGSGYKVGQHVQAQWRDGNWYGAKVVGYVEGGNVEVAWDDGADSNTWLKPTQVRAG